MFKTILTPRFEGVPLLPAANDLALNGGRTYGFPLWRMLGFVNSIIAIIFITGLGHVYLGYEFQHISCSLSCTLALFSCLDHVCILSFAWLLPTNIPYILMFAFDMCLYISLVVSLYSQWVHSNLALMVRLVMEFKVALARCLKLTLAALKYHFLMFSSGMDF